LIQSGLFVATAPFPHPGEISTGKLQGIADDETSSGIWPTSISGPASARASPSKGIALLSLHA
jgi:hypothetical protein